MLRVRISPVVAGTVFCLLSVIGDLIHSMAQDFSMPSYMYIPVLC